MKKLTALFLAFLLISSLSACGILSEPEEPEKTLSQKTDEELIIVLLDGMDKQEASPAFLAEYSVRCLSADQVLTSVEGTLGVKGTQSHMTVTATAAGESATVDYVYTDGVFYVNAAGVKVRYPASAEQILPYLESTVSSEFDDVFSYAFAKRSLLRETDGGYTVVLSDPTQNLPVSDGEEDPRITEVKDFFVSLRFSSRGALMGTTFRMTCTVASSDTTTEVVYVSEYDIVSTDGREVYISAPEDAESYAEGSDNPFADPTTDSEASSGTSDAA